jgi:hypothetical protein
MVKLEYLGSEAEPRVLKLWQDLGIKQVEVKESEGKHPLTGIGGGHIVLEVPNHIELESKTYTDFDHISQTIKYPCGCVTYVCYDYYTGRGGKIILSSSCGKH